MRYNTAYKFRFYPTAEQKAALAEVFGHARYVWNGALDLRTRSYDRRDSCNEGKNLTYTATSKRLTKHKKEKEWLYDVSSVLHRLRKAQRRLSRNKKGSNNWKKQKRRVARLHARIADKRNDFLHKLSRKTTRENQVIALETLNVKGMQRREASAVSVQNRSLSRSISDTGWSTLVRYIEYKAEWAGRTVVKIDRWFPSTKRCSACGHVGETKPLSVRHWQCEECGEHHDRDVNAAKNIRTVGLAGAQKFLREDCEGRGTTHNAFVRRGHGPGKQSF